MAFNFIRIKWILPIALLAFGSLSLSADTVSTFSIDGTLTITDTGVTWTLSTPPFTSDEAVIGAGADGTYAGLDGTDVTIEPVSLSSTLPLTFLFFDADPAASALVLTGATPGFGTSAACTATPPAAGQICTLTGTPVTLINTSSKSSSLLFDLTGDTADGKSTWEGDFSTQFGESYQSLLATLGGGGTATSTFSATFTVDTPTSATPEPTTTGASVVGLGLILLRARKRRAA